MGYQDLSPEEKMRVRELQDEANRLKAQAREAKDADYKDYLLEQAYDLEEAIQKIIQQSWP